MGTSLLPKAFKRTAGTKLDKVALRGFGGGWNAIDDDISMSPKYLVTQHNMHRTSSGASEVRYGQQWFADVKDVVAGDVVDCFYFANSIISVTEEGEIAVTDADGVNIAIWNNAIAGALPGAPTGWTSSVEQVTFVPFRDSLVIHNGVDKPVSIDVALVTTYLQDLPTGSNTNVPIGKYGCVVGNYHVVAGIPAAPTTIYIASKATSGTFPGDAAPNDSISIDVGAYAPAGATEIRGVAGFRQYLIVFFLTQAAIFTLGTYDSGGAHTPIPFDTIPHFGLLGQRCVVQLDKDLFIADLDGAGTASRNLFSGLVDTDQLSDIIAPAYRGSVGNINADVLLKGAFTAYDRLGDHVMLFVPGGQVFVYSENSKLRYKAWSPYGFAREFRSGCSTAFGRVILTRGSRLYQVGNKAFDEEYRGDFVNDHEADWLHSTIYSIGQIIRDPITDQCFTCSVNHTSPATGTFAEYREMNVDYWTEYLGEEIPFEMETPWIAGRDAMQTKQNRFIGLQTKGNAPFTLEAYVDNLYKDVDGNVIYDPAVTMDFVGNDTSGYGNEDEQPYGGGRRSGDPRLWSFPVKFKSIKFRITGASSQRSLNVISILALFSRGNYKRA